MPVLAAGDGALQVLLFSYVCLLYCSALLVLEPFLDEENQQTELLTLGAIFAVMMSLFLFRSDSLPLGFFFWNPILSGANSTPFELRNSPGHTVPI